MSELRAENQLWDGKATIDNKMVDSWDRKAVSVSRISESREGKTMTVKERKSCHRELNSRVKGQKSWVEKARNETRKAAQNSRAE